MKLSLLNHRNIEFEDYLINFFDKILEKHINDKLEGFFVFGQPFESIRYLAGKYGCPVIAIELSAIRVDAGYTQSLFYANVNGLLLGGNEGKDRYNNFLAEHSTVPLFSRRELIALFCKEDWIPLIPLLEIEPDLEVIVLGAGIKVTPQILSVHQSTEDDLRWKCNKLFPAEKILYRERPYYSDYFARIIQNPDPIQTILSCKRIAALASNSLIEAMLWNRTACTNNNAMSFAFQCEKDFTSLKKVDLRYLNYLFFAFWIPGYENLFSPDYWIWRLAQPSETDIYLKHLSICLGKVGLDESIFSLNEDERYKIILQNRGCSDNMITQTLKTVTGSELDFNALVSQAEVQKCDTDGSMQTETQFCLNSYDGDMLTSRFEIYASKNLCSVLFLPLNRQNGFARIESFAVEGAEVLTADLSQLKHEMYDFNPACQMKFSEITSEKVTITFRWRIKPFTVDRLYELLSNRSTLTDACNNLVTERNSLVAELDEFKESSIWRATKPIRFLVDTLRRRKQ